MKKANIYWVTTFSVSAVLCIGAVFVSELGRFKSGIPLFAYPVEYEGEYYYKMRSQPLNTNPEFHITYTQYYIYKNYNETGSTLSSLGVFLLLATTLLFVVLKRRSFRPDRFFENIEKWTAGR